MYLWWCSNVYKRLQSFIGRYFYCAFLRFCLGIVSNEQPGMSSLGWGNLVAFDWNDLLVGRGFDCKFLKKVKSPPYALPAPPHPHQHYIDRCIIPRVRVSLRHRQNYTLVKSVCETALKIYPCSGLPPVYQGLSVCHDWPVKKSRWQFVNQVERKLETHFR